MALVRVRVCKLNNLLKNLKKMTDKKNGQGSVGISSVVAAMAGAVVGGIAAASALVMADKGNQEKVSEVVSAVKEDVEIKKAVVVNKAQKLEAIAKKAVKDAKSV